MGREVLPSGLGRPAPAPGRGGPLARAVFVRTFVRANTGRLRRPLARRRFARRGFPVIPFFPIMSRAISLRRGCGDGRGL